jgi:hypothetical protein
MGREGCRVMRAGVTVGVRRCNAFQGSEMEHLHMNWLQLTLSLDCSN